MSYLAIDLGASSGRAMLGTLRNDALEIREVHRFPNAPARVGNRIHWNVLSLLTEVKQSIEAAVRVADDEVLSFGIDTWGLDFGLLDASDQLLSNPYHYRDMGSRDVQPELSARIPARELYDRTGIQSLAFNSLNQLVRLQDERPALLEQSRTLLMTPDLMRFFLTGERQNEYTIASTSQCLSIETNDWDVALLQQCGIPTHMLAPIVAPGSPGGILRESVARELGVPRIAAVAVTEHDTASAMIATGGQPGQAFLSLGTWGLLGTLVDQPVTSDRAFRANLANEGGIEGTYRLLRNIMGLWLMEHSRVCWSRQGIAFDHAEMTRLIDAVEPLQAFIDPDDPRLIDPPDLPSEIARLTGLAADDTGAILRCITDSLAMKSRYVLELIEAAAGLTFPGLHLLGGGSRNAPLCQAMANALGRPVWAGPAEATTIGNLLVQMHSAGAIGSFEEGAALVSDNRQIRRFEPMQSDRWQDAYLEFLDRHGLEPLQ